MLLFDGTRMTRIYTDERGFFYLSSLMVLLSIVSCKPGTKRPGEKEPGREVVPALQAILDSAGVNGAILVFDPSKNIYYSNDFERCETGHLPASTFKIPNSIIALETGVMESDSTMIRWDGEKSKLSISSRTENIMKRLMVIDENETFILSGKTGWSVRNGNNNGWFVGYLEKGEKVYFVATNIDPQSEFNMDLFPVIRKEISIEAIKVLW